MIFARWCAAISPPPARPPPTTSPRSAASCHQLLDLGGCSSHVLVLPDAHDMPARFGEPPVGIYVSRPVPGDLVRPVPLVHGRDMGTVLRTPVPEAPVNKDSYAAGTEHDVDLPSSPSDDRTMQSIPQASSMKFSPQCQLRGSIDGALLLHPSAYGRRRCKRHTTFGHRSYPDGWSRPPSQSASEISRPSAMRPGRDSAALRPVSP